MRYPGRAAIGARLAAVARKDSHMDEPGGGGAHANRRRSRAPGARRRAESGTAPAAPGAAAAQEHIDAAAAELATRTAGADAAGVAGETEKLAGRGSVRQPAPELVAMLD